MIHVTEAAAEKINELLVEENKTGAGLRVFVQGGGCSGFQYGLMIDEGEGDPASDLIFEVNGVRLFVDPISLRYLKGAEVDFVDNQMGGGFTIQNPNAKSTCGCGSSFSACRELRRDDSLCPSSLRLSSARSCGRRADDDPASATSSSRSSCGRKHTSARTSWSI